MTQKCTEMWAVATEQREVGVCVCVQTRAVCLNTCCLATFKCMISVLVGSWLDSLLRKRKQNRAEIRSPRPTLDKSPVVQLYV